MKNLLISGLGGSLFPYLNDKLKDNFNIVYVDSDITLVKLYPDYKFVVAPLVASAKYIDFIKGLIVEFNIDLYIPLIDEEIINAKKEIEGYNNVKVLSPNISFSALCLNKFELMQVLRDNNISFIKSSIGHLFNEPIIEPIFVKPISGRGSRGIKKIMSQEELNAYYILEKYLPSEILIQEYIEGTEYTIGATVNNLNNLLSISIKRVIRKKGITQIAIIEENDLLTEVVKDIVNKLKPEGPINIQLYLTEKNEVKIFEINPRFSTTTIMSYEGGLDELSLYIENYGINFSKEPLQPKFGIVLHRRWESVFYEA